jgi:hypothetical protein
MGAVQFSNITDLKRQAVEKKAYEFYENNDPGMKAFGEAVDKPPLTEKGYRLPNYAVRPTGETWFTPSNSDFNAAKPPQTVSDVGLPHDVRVPDDLDGFGNRVNGERFGGQH